MKKLTFILLFGLIAAPVINLNSYPFESVVNKIWNSSRTTKAVIAAVALAGIAYRAMNSNNSMRGPVGSSGRSRIRKPGRSSSVQPDQAPQPVSHASESAAVVAAPAPQPATAEPPVSHVSASSAVVVTAPATQPVQTEQPVYDSSTTLLAVPASQSTAQLNAASEEPNIKEEERHIKGTIYLIDNGDGRKKNWGIKTDAGERFSIEDINSFGNYDREDDPRQKGYPISMMVTIITEGNDRPYVKFINHPRRNDNSFRLQGEMHEVSWGQYDKKWCIVAENGHKYFPNNLNPAYLDHYNYGSFKKEGFLIDITAKFNKRISDNSVFVSLQGANRAIQPSAANPTVSAASEAAAVASASSE